MIDLYLKVSYSIDFERWSRIEILKIRNIIVFMFLKNIVKLLK